MAGPCRDGKGTSLVSCWTCGKSPGFPNLLLTISPGSIRPGHFAALRGEYRRIPGPYATGAMLTQSQPRELQGEHAQKYESENLEFVSEKRVQYGTVHRSASKQPRERYGSIGDYARRVINPASVTETQFLVSAGAIWHGHWGAIWHHIRWLLLARLAAVP